ncbi:MULTISPECIES: tetratricopeptide repeat protein [Clostridium]|uniref:Uncharacterized protein n=1 Tax=Clostridium frigoriphilum TaxID=443253 RepID=A0ABU7UVD5_9CLOT|nr:hypothetical protein [Clostridium sp. DSM 17811]MBU3102243.1 hypothetical protein [Clostridium sp. DSM 17811]
MLNINKFHNDRDVWMQARKAECISLLGDPEAAINLLEQLLVKKDHWTIHKTIFQMKIDLKYYDEGLGHAFMAALTKDPPDKKINLYYKIGQVLEMKKEYKYALMHYVFVKQIRVEKKWNIPSELIQCIDRLSVKDEIKTDNLHMQLRDYWVSQKILISKRFEGFIMKFLPNGKAGFIKVKNNSYYFRTSSILSLKKDVFKDVKVSFSLVDSFDIKKGISTKEAVDILLTEDKEKNNGKK